ncbi:MAG: hypothetical protein V8R91_06655 [Butyricimonas faecihominis]
MRKLESLNVNFSDGTEWFLPNDMSSMLSLKEFKPGQLKVPDGIFCGILYFACAGILVVINDIPDRGLAGRNIQVETLEIVRSAGTNIYSLPDDIGELAENLTTLNLRGCQALASLGENIGN